MNMNKPKTFGTIFRTKESNVHKKLCLFATAFSLLGCAAAFVPATDNPDKKLAQAYDLLSVYRAKPARQLIDESIAIYKNKENTEKLAYAYLVSTDYYRYLASEAYQTYNPKPTFTVKPVPLGSVMGVRTEKVWAAHRLAEETYKKVIADAIATNDQLKASFNYQMLYLLYARNAQLREACDALDGELEQFNLAKAAKPDLQVYVDKEKYDSEFDAVEKIKKSLKCNELQ